MIPVRFESCKTVLCLGAHSDDIEIGCGGTLLKLVRGNPDLECHWVVFSGEGRRTVEARKSAQMFLKGCAHSKITVRRFQTSFFPFVGKDIKKFFEKLKGACQPDLIFTHHRDDRHQDHRVISDLTWNTFRDHLILEYEVPKYDGDLGCPNLYVRLDEATCRSKTRTLLQCFRTQRNKHWFTEDTFMSLLRIRGVECAAPDKYAEAFYCRKIIV
jgi:LmbE family N-acetylglucosaminyl deacetylase